VVPDLPLRQSGANLRLEADRISAVTVVSPTAILVKDPKPSKPTIVSVICVLWLRNRRRTNEYNTGTDNIR
jgi:hypothetical protein